MNLQSIKAQLSLIFVIVITVAANAAPELRIVKSDSVSEYEITSADSQLVTAINETVLTTSSWHFLESGTGTYSFSDLAKTLQGLHIHLLEDEPLLIKGSSSARQTEEIKVKEIIVGLYRADDESLSANRFFAITTDAKVVVLQKVSGHKIITELVPLINKM